MQTASGVGQPLYIHHYIACCFVCDLLHEQIPTFKGHDRQTLGITTSDLVMGGGLGAATIFNKLV
jgi:hypothetical protein